MSKTGTEYLQSRADDLSGFWQQNKAWIAESKERITRLEKENVQYEIEIKELEKDIKKLEKEKSK